MDIDAVILAGGLSSRMGVNKSLVKLQQKNLICHVIERISPQVNKVWISTNEILDEYPHSIQFSDTIYKKIGPLGGIYSALNKIESEWIQFCPNDCPFLPEDLVKKLYNNKKNNNVKILIPKVNNKNEPTFILCHRSTIESIPSLIEKKIYKLMNWIEANNFQTIEFLDDHAFSNINDRSTLESFQNG